MRNNLKIAGLGALAIIILGLAWIIHPSPTELAKCDLVISTAEAQRHFAVKIAERQPDLEHGLMGRNHLDENEGMLFYFGRKRRIAMWMKDTLIPLDMLFIDERGRLVNIAENAPPLSEKQIDSKTPVLAVLEISGGTARKFGIKIGDNISCPPFLPEGK